MNTAHYLATWVLPNKMSDHRYRGIVESFPWQALPPMAHAGIVHRCNLIVYLVRRWLLWLQGGQDYWPTSLILLYLLSCHVVLT
jgi:hypothetical protein